MRTFKYRMDVPRNDAVTLRDAIRRDHERVFGMASKPDAVSLIDFWIETVRCGVVLAPDADALRKLLNEISDGEAAGQYDAYWDGLPEQRRERVNREKFLDFLNHSPRQATLDGFKRKTALIVEGNAAESDGLAEQLFAVCNEQQKGAAYRRVIRRYFAIPDAVEDAIAALRANAAERGAGRREKIGWSILPVPFDPQSRIESAIAHLLAFGASSGDEKRGRGAVQVSGNRIPLFWDVAQQKPTLRETAHPVRRLIAGNHGLAWECVEGVEQEEGGVYVCGVGVLRDIDAPREPQAGRHRSNAKQKSIRAYLPPSWFSGAARGAFNRLGLDDSGNGLNALFKMSGGGLLETLLRDVPCDEIVEKVLASAAGTLWSADDLRHRIAYLQATARRLRDFGITTDGGAFAKNWAEYRSLIKGRLDSYVQNLCNRIPEIYSDLLENHQRIQRLREKTLYVSGDRLGRDVHENVISELIGIGNHLLTSQDIPSTIIEELDIYGRSLATLREWLEPWQRSIREDVIEVSAGPRKSVEKAWIHHDLIDRQDDVDGKKLRDVAVPDALPRYPRFFGEAQREAWRWFHAAPRTFAACYRFVATIIDRVMSTQPAPPEDIEGEVRVQLGGLNRLRQQLPEGQMRDRLTEFLRNTVSKDATQRIDEPPHRWALFVSPRQSRKPKLIPLRSNDCEKLGDDVEHFLSDVLALPSGRANSGEILRSFGWREGRFGQEAAEAMRLFPSLTGLRLQHRDAHGLTRGDLERMRDDAFAGIKMPTGVQVMLDRLPREGMIPLSKLQRFVTAGLLAEMRGCMTLLSRSAFTARWIVQTTNGDQSWLVYEPHPEDARRIVRRTEYRLQSDALRVLRRLRHRWGVALEFRDAAAVSRLRESAIVFKKALALKKMSPEGTVCAYADREQRNLMKRASYFSLLGSRWHLQFLEQFLDPQRRETVVSPRGGSLICEEEQGVHWTDSWTCDLQSKPETTRFFFALPFDVKPSAVRDGYATLRDQHGAQRVLGIDLGEYGFGYAVLDVISGKVVAEDGRAVRGFIEEPQLIRLREAVRRLHIEQQIGTFSRPSSRIQRLREHAAESMRNQIHALALTHKAMPVYEHEVDAFETGGRRIRVLYETIKRSDVYDPTDAAKAVRDHVWGKGVRPAGRVIGARYTSQTCEACGLCAADFMRQHALFPARVMERKGEQGYVVVAEQRIAVHVARDQELFERIGALENAVREYARPPEGTISGSTSEQKRRRGGQGRFRCPFQDCPKHHWTISADGWVDADDQAARNIALKYIARARIERERPPGKQKTIPSEETMEKFFALTRELAGHRR